MKRCMNLSVVLVLCGTLVFAGDGYADQGGSFKDKAQSAWASPQVMEKRIARSVASGWKAIRKTSDRLTDKFIGKMSQPLDRSAADKKAAMLNSALQEADRVSAVAAAKAKLANKEIYNLKKEGFGSYSDPSSSSSGSKSKGRFTSLD